MSVHELAEAAEKVHQAGKELQDATSHLASLKHAVQTAESRYEKAWAGMCDARTKLELAALAMTEQIDIERTESNA